MSSCNITEEACASLASALKSNPSFPRELDLSNKDLRKSDMKLLSAVLGSPLWKLETLRSVIMFRIELIVSITHHKLYGVMTWQHSCLCTYPTGLCTCQTILFLGGGGGVASAKPQPIFSLICIYYYWLCLCYLTYILIYYLFAHSVSQSLNYLMNMFLS